MVSNKIFVIGFNKCGTSSLHVFFKKNKLKSIHWGGSDERDNLACMLMRNFMLGRSILYGIDEYDAYSDLAFANDSIYIEGSRFYKQFYEEYPDAMYILNTRDLAGWINSRFNHHKGTLRIRAMKIYDCSEEELIALWTNQFIRHHTEVKKYFSETGGNLLEFNIESDPVENLVDFLKPIGNFDPKYWSRANATYSPPSEKRL